MVEKKSLRRVLLVAGMVMAMFLLQPSPHAFAALTIDDFSNNQPLVGFLSQDCTNPVSPDISDHIAAPAAIGGHRLLQGNIINDPAGGWPPNCLAGRRLSLFVAASFYSFSLDSTVEGNGSIVWSGGPTAGLYLLNSDFSGNGDHITIKIEKTDADVVLYLDLYSTDATHASRAPIPLSQGFSGDVTIALSTTGAGSYMHYFETQLGGASNVEFANVDEVRLSWQGPADLDLTIDDIIVQGEATVSCVSKTFNGNPSITIDPVTGPPGTDINVCVTVKNDASSTVPTAIWIRDTLDPSAAGHAWAYVPGSTSWTCNPLSGCPTVQQPTVGANTLEWDTSPETLEPDQSMTICYTMRVTDLATGNYLENCVSVKERELDPFPPCGSQCRARVTARTSERVPSMSGWGAIATFILLGAGGIYLMRRKRGSVA